MTQAFQHPLIEKLLASTELLKDILIEKNPKVIEEVYTIVAIFRETTSQEERDALLRYIDKHYSYDYMMLTRNDTLELRVCLQ